MKASIGDRLIIKSHHSGEPDRDAEISRSAAPTVVPRTSCGGRTPATRVSSSPGPTPSSSTSGLSFPDAEPALSAGKRDSPRSGDSPAPPGAALRRGCVHSGSCSQQLSPLPVLLLVDLASGKALSEHVLASVAEPLLLLSREASAPITRAQTMSIVAVMASQAPQLQLSCHHHMVRSPPFLGFFEVVPPALNRRPTIDPERVVDEGGPGHWPRPPLTAGFDARR